MFENNLYFMRLKTLEMKKSIFYLCKLKLSRSFWCDYKRVNHQKIEICVTLMLTMQKLLSFHPNTVQS
jgi:hypothetical protein